MRTFNALLELIFPRGCLSCGQKVETRHENLQHQSREQSAEKLCHLCLSKMRLGAYSGLLETFPFFTQARYGLEIAAIVVQAKEENSRTARQFLAQTITQSFTEKLLPHFIDAYGVGNQARVNALFLSVPSASATERRRGFSHGKALTREIVRLVNAHPNPPFCRAEALDPFTVKRVILDQRLLNRSSREQNLEGAYEITPTARGRLEAWQTRGHEALEPSSARNRTHWLLVLVDDVMTSGSTIREGIRALHLAGFYPDAALLGCVSPRLISP